MLQVRVWVAAKVSGQQAVEMFYTTSSGWPISIEVGHGSVRVMAWADTYATADFDSGWFLFNSQNGINSYKEVSHNLNVVPGRVKVLVQATSGVNDGMIFHGMGSAQNDDLSGTSYGGVIFGYNAAIVRLWAPMKNTGSATGYIINVINGWGGETNVQQ